MPENNQILSVEGQLVGMPLAGPESFSQQQLDYLKRALGVDETVLWDGNGTLASSCILSETSANFEIIRIYAGESLSYITCMEFPGNSVNFRLCCGSGGTNAWLDLFHVTRNTDTLTVVADKRLNFGGVTSTTATYTVSIGNKACLFKVVGIHRIAGGN